MENSGSKQFQRKQSACTRAPVLFVGSPGLGAAPVRDTACSCKTAFSGTQHPGGKLFLSINYSASLLEHSKLIQVGTGSRCPGAMRAVGWGASLAWNPFPWLPWAAASASLPLARCDCHLQSPRRCRQLPRTPRACSLCLPFLVVYYSR